jgi:hypothetical protein
MGRLSNYTLAGIEAQLYPTRAAEFRRGKDKKKRKSRSLRDNIMGTTTAGRIARGVGAAGALALGGKLIASKMAARKPIGMLSPARNPGTYSTNKVSNAVNNFRQDVVNASRKSRKR